MGMAASQSRYLELTARQSNIEYQGQQINQQRTVLSNQSSAYNTQLLSMQVPTAPSTSSFSKTTYAFTYGTDKCTMDTIASNHDADNTYTIAYNYTTIEDTGASSKINISRTKKDENSDYTYSTKNGNLSLVDYTSDSDEAKKDANNLSTIYGTNYKGDEKDGAKYYKYTDSNDTVRYVKAEDLEAMKTDNEKVTCSYVQEDASVTHSEVIKNAQVKWDNSGRITYFTEGDDTTKYTMNVTTTTDDKAYNDAMNQYEYDKSIYNKQISDVNAKLDIVQQQDKTLELQLKALDTERTAISTEQEAVKKVIQKNTEGTFKTFA